MSFFSKKVMILSVIFCVYGGVIPSLAAPMSLRELTEIMDKKNLELQMQFKKMQQIQAQYDRSFSQLLPKLDASYERAHNDLQGTRRLSDSPLTDAEIDSLVADPIDSNRFKISLNQVLFSATIPKELKIKRLEYEIAQMDYEFLRQQKRLEAAESYLNVASYLQQKDLYEKEQQVLDVRLEEIKNKNALNLYTKKDVYQVELDAARAKENQLKNRQDLRLSYAVLNRLIGKDQREAVDVDMSVLNPTVLLDISDSLGAFELAKSKRPDLQALEMQRQLIGVQIALEKNRYWPTVFGGMQYGVVKADDFEFHRPNQDFSWQVGAKMPLFTGFETASKIKELRLRSEELDLEIQQKQERIREDINKALFAMELAVLKQKNTKYASQLADEQLTMAKAKFAEKQATDLDIAEAEKAVHEAAVLTSLSQFELARAVAQFRFAIGHNPAVF